MYPKLTEMQFMFRNASSFNSDLSQWDTSSAQNMIYMFQNATSFNQNLIEWDVSSTTPATGGLEEFSQGHPHLVIVLKNGVSQTLTLRLTIFLQEVN